MALNDLALRRQAKAAAGQVAGLEERIMIIEFTLVEVGENEAVVTLETENWIVAIPATLADPSCIIDTDKLESPDDFRQAMNDLRPD